MRKEYKINHTKAWDYFVSIGKIPANAKKNEYVLHHIDYALKDNDIERYNSWNPEDLVVMTRSEHMQLHCNLRKLIYGDCFINRKPHCNKGKTRTEETKEKISESLHKYWDAYWKEHPRKVHVPVDKEIAKQHKCEGLAKFWNSEEGQILRDATSERFKNIERTDSWKNNISNGLKKRYASKEGKVLKEEISKRLSKKLYAKNIVTDEVLEFKNFDEACKKLNLKYASNISRSMRNKQPYHGYIWYR